MALWGLRWHNDGRPHIWWEPKPQVKLWAFAASDRGCFVIVESDSKPAPDADLLNPDQLRVMVKENSPASKSHGR
jgi:hypothetical protein